MGRLDNKNAIVTGSSRGIGKSIALKLASEGARVCITGTKQDTVDAVVKELTTQGYQAIGMKINVASYSEMEALIQKVKETWGSVDILVNNAGITKDTLLLKMTTDDFKAVVDINMTGTFNGMKAAVPVMMRQKAGKIINISSVIGLIGNIGQTNYAASKAGIIAMTKSVAKEYAKKGLCVNAIAPGYIQTDMSDAISDGMKEEIIKQIPMQKIGQPEDIAKAVVFLASSDADYITGQTLVVDGGMVMC